MEKIRAVKNRTLFAGALAFALTGLAVLLLSLMGVGCATVELRMSRERQYDPNYGETAEAIIQNFNLRHGRYYNYFSRGAVYLAFGHYQEAIEDFNEAISKQERDSRNTPTYGMHFIDYFPHRESGVAYYFLGESATIDCKEQLYKHAIEELEISNRHEETARTQSYLNLARRALWNVTKEQDRISPIIRTNVTIPIYTNRRTVRLDVTATDDVSYVGDIRVEVSLGDVEIERPGPSTKFAQKEVTTPIEITLGPEEKGALVAITALDLAGNKSETMRVPVILDTQAPTAGISIVGEQRHSDGLVRISIEAQDDLSLQQIQVGKDPADKVECDGALKYTGTLTGSPDGKELAIKLLDNAGNSTLVSIPVDETPGQAPPPSEPRSRIIGRLPRADILNIPSYNQRLSRGYFAGLDPSLPHRAIHLDWTINTNISPFNVAQRRKQVRGRQKLELEKYVKPEGGKKETSETNFTVAGKILNHLNINRIKVEMEGQSVEPSLGSAGHGFCTFSGSLDLTKVPFDQEQIVSVQAYADNNRGVRPLSETLKVVKRKNPSLDSVAIYGILVLPLSLSDDNESTAPKASWALSQLVSSYEDLVAELKALKMPARHPESLYKDENAFRVYDIGDVYTGASAEEWCKKPRSPLSVAKYIRDRWNKRASSDATNPAQIDPNFIDLVVFGELTIHSITTKENEPNEEDVEIVLRARDVELSKPLHFKKNTLSYTPVLADSTYRQYSKEYLAQGMRKELPKKQIFEDDKKQVINELAVQVAKYIPRLRPPPVFYSKDSPGTEDTLQFELDELAGRNRIFIGMKAWLYAMDVPINALLKKVECQELRDFDPNYCRIKCDRHLSESLQKAKAYGCTLITK